MQHLSFRPVDILPTLRCPCNGGYEDKLLGKIDEAFWAERNAASQAELAEIKRELQTIENAPSKADLLAAARKPVELLQAAPTLYVIQKPAEKARLLKTMVSKYTITRPGEPRRSSGILDLSEPSHRGVE